MVQHLQNAGGGGALSSCAMSCQEQLPPEDSEQEEMEDLEDLELEELEELDPLRFVCVVCLCFLKDSTRLPWGSPSSITIWGSFYSSQSLQQEKPESWTHMKELNIKEVKHRWCAACCPP